MRGWRRVDAATAVAAILFVYCIGVPACSAAEQQSTHFILFYGTDIWRNGAFAYGGLLWSPNGLDQDGFTFKALISGGGYRYLAGSLGGREVDGGELAGQLLPGWRMKSGALETKFFVGLDIRRNQLWPDDPDNRLRGNNVGVRFAGELWYEPTPTTMLAADAAISTVATDYSARAAFGWRVFDKFYLGPETQLYGGDGYRQFRFGLHATGFKTDYGEWCAAAGWSRDTDERSSPYLRIGYMRRL
jgi:hypothetical protein